MISRRSLSSLFFLQIVAVLASASLVAGRHQGPTRLVVKPLKASGIYDVGEKVGWTVSIPPDASVPASAKPTYTIKRNNQELIETGELDLSSGKAFVEVTGNQPEMLYMQLSFPGGGRPMAFGAAVTPRKLRPAASRPRDFDSFWKSKIDALEAVPENPQLTPGESGKPDVEYATIQMDLVGGSHVYGQLAKPAKPGKYPAMLVLQWASPPYPLQRPWVVDRAAQGWLVLNIEPHDVLPTAPQSYYSALPQAIKNYASIGQQSRDESYFLNMYLRDYRAADYLSHRPDWDGKTLVVIGTSMGGQQSLCVAGLHPKITHLIVEEPSGCDIDAALHARQTGYPYFASNDPKAMETAPYFDCINFARRIRATCLVAMGFVDTIAPPTGIWTAFNQIRGSKEAAPMVDAPHNNIATREQQRPYTDRAEAWLDTLVHGRKVNANKGMGLP